MNKQELKKDWKADGRECFIIDDAWKGGKKEGYKQAQKDIIKLFKGDHIYSGAVIKFEISNMK